MGSFRGYLLSYFLKCGFYLCSIFCFSGVSFLKQLDSSGPVHMVKEKAIVPLSRLLPTPLPSCLDLLSRGTFSSESTLTGRNYSAPPPSVAETFFKSTGV